MTCKIDLKLRNNFVLRLFATALVVLGLSPSVRLCAAGTEAASFLDIPVGAGPAALGSAYTAQATDAYAPVWNPAGLARLDSIQATGMHVPYLESVNYEFLSVVVPLAEKSAGVGAAIQYLGSGDIPGRDESGDPSGSFSTTFAAYTLAYGRQVSESLSIGTAAKLITEKISDASGTGYAVDLGLLYRIGETFTLGAAAVNLGPSLKLVSEGDPLPAALRAGATLAPFPSWEVSLESVYRREGPFSGSLGLEYKHADQFSLRAGYDTSRTKELGASAGLRGGVALFYKGQEFSYAASPFGDLGIAQYLSLVFRFTSKPPADRPKPPASHFEDIFGGFDTHYNMDDLLSDQERKLRGNR